MLCFSCYAHPRDLHSFPTRRSSDLGHVSVQRVPKPVIKIIDIKCPDSHEGHTVSWDNIDLAEPHDEFKLDRKSTRLNSSHVEISYAVFCLKKKKIRNIAEQKTIRHK